MPIHRIDAVRSWMFDAALPLWADRGVDRQNGGFVEALDFSGRDAGIAFRRTRVTCRQVYVFSHAALLGHKEYLPLADLGVEYLASKTWMPGPGAFARRLTRAGEVLDATIDLYDHAFALFAFAWRHRVDRDANALAWAHRTHDAIDQHLDHPSAMGFQHETPPTGWRQQNPHMHLLEACLAAYEASGEARFADTARRMADLFAARFFQRESGRLAEFFDEELRPAPGEAGRITEPGHQFEWSWILSACRRLLGVDLGAEALALIASGERDGVDPVSRATFNQVAMDGAPLDRGSRTWPNTERLKAAIARLALNGADPGPVLAETTDLLLDRYLATDIRGGWIDAFDAEGRAAAANMPASTLYHLFLAFAEMLRIDAGQG